MITELEAENALAVYYIVKDDYDPPVWRRVRISKRANTIYCESCNKSDCIHTIVVRQHRSKYDDE